MDDKGILDLYWARQENAICETAAKYGRYCHCIAYNILRNNEDSEECVNDTYLKAWETIPPQRPDMLSVYLGKITRRLSLNRYKFNHAQKRGSGQVALVLEELQTCIPSINNTEHLADDMVLTEILNRFLAGLSPESRMFFMRRYWYLSAVREIAADFSVSESKVKMSLSRSRDKLRTLLEKEGITV